MLGPTRSLIPIDQDDIVEFERRLGTSSRRVLETWLAGYGSPTSRATMRRNSRAVARDLFGFTGEPEGAPWALLGFPGRAPEAGAQYRAHLVLDVTERRNTRDEDKPKGISLATANARLAALRGVGTALWTLGVLAGEDLARLKAAAKTLPGDSHRRQSTVDDREAVRLDLAAEGCPPNERLLNRTLLALLSLGLRRSEAADLRWSDMREVGGGTSFQVIGKGGHRRLVHLDDARREKLEEWRECCKDPTLGPVLRRMRKGDRILSDGLSGDGVYRRTRRLMAAAGIPERGAHGFRRAFASSLLRAGMDTATVARAGGWKSLDMVLKYDVVREEEEARRVRTALAGSSRASS